MSNLARAERVSRTTISLLLALLFTAPMLSGCFGDAIKIGDSSDSEHWLPPVEERENLVYDNSDVFSRVSWNGTYGIDMVRSIYVSVPEITTADGGAGVTGGAEVHLGLWLPQIGCPFSSETSFRAAYRGHSHLFRWLCENGCPVDYIECRRIAALFFARFGSPRGDGYGDIVRQSEAFLS